MPPSARTLRKTALAASIAAAVVLAVAGCNPAPRPGASSSSAPPDSAPVAAESSPTPTSAAPAAGADVRPDQPTLTRLASATTSGFTEPAELVLRDAPALAEAWRTLHGGIPAESPPAVDLARDMVVLVALGERSSGGHAVRVDGVSPAGDGATVRYTATRPGASCMTTMEITSPVDAVRVPRVDGAVRFERRDVVREC